ncbi:Nucleoside:H+ symporter:Major facilitator superfamily [Methylophaga thiooxydans]|uniref:Nucleoside:H+ symporter:Major facilitator superfamily n=1 Tax=Methylophaga thiooxydans TaxID=392484 RepID=A0A0A0BD97_9GAMM|nr:MFS transporter [Methylophaga thiooxydans]KGM05926.1 Nucleoside:H+ symporter:Major facilitator superfamily [Methylophaga thiooxydans]
MPFSQLPYWRLSGFYFFYFACLGVLVPYWSLYLKWEGFSASDIGELTAILLASRIIAPNVWGWIADHHGQRMRIVRFASFAATLVFTAIFFNQSYLWVAATLLLFSFFWNASLPQFEVTTLQHLGEHSHHYSKVRVWGSIGFIVIVMALGWLLEFFDPSIVPIALFLSTAGIWLVSLSVPESASRHMSLTQVSLKTLLKRPAVIAFLLMCFLMQASHGPYYTFYTIYLEENGYGRGLIGQLWALGVFAEVIIFLFMHRWLPKFGLRYVLLVSLVLSACRWLLIALFPQNLPVLTFAQLLHAASYGTYHAAAIAWVHRHFTGKTQGRGQALYSSVSFGAGGALGSLISGYLWLTPGPMWTYFLAAIACVIAFAISYVWLKEDDSHIKAEP